MTAKGMSKIRVGKECRPYYMTEEDRSRVVVPDLTPDDLSLSSIRWAIEQHHKHFKTPKQQWRDPFDYLVEARLLEKCAAEGDEEPQFRVPLATLILFGKEQSLTRVLPFFETVIITPAGTNILRKNAADAIKEICGGETSLARAFCPAIPLETFRELVVNAYIHRSYRTNGPVIFKVTDSEIAIESPGELPAGMNTDNLIYCVPIYRNLLLADGTRFFGLCDKVGKGIDSVFMSVVAGGFDFPVFESNANRFTARLSLERSEEFREYVRRRSQILSQLDEVMTIRFLWVRGVASLVELSGLLQRGREVTRRILESMLKKLMVEPVDGDAFRLSETVWRDIEAVFAADQLVLKLFNDN
jgi:Putative ATP-dependent DNA helicase recG C-terminal